MNADCSDCSAKDETILGLANRLTAASEVLGHLAQRDGRVSEILRLRGYLEMVVSCGGQAEAIAREGLRWNTPNS
jgi:hypothetical protein